MLIAIGNPQPPTPLKIDNSTVHSILHNNITQKKSKSWDMRYHWLCQKNNIKNIITFGNLVTKNGDYFTKHHPPYYHRAIRSRYVKDIPTLSAQKTVAPTRSARVCWNPTTYNGQT